MAMSMCYYSLLRGICFDKPVSQLTPGVTYGSM